MSDLPATPPGPKEGEEVTVVIIAADGTRYISTGTFESAKWNTDWIEEPSGSWNPEKKFRMGETTLDLRFRRVTTVRATPEVAQGQRMLDL